MWRPDPPEKIEHLDVDTAGRTVGDALLWGGTEHIYGPAGGGTHRLVVLHDFGSGLEPVTDADGLWLYGAYPGTEY